MARPYTMEEIDQAYEEFNRQKDLVEELSDLTPETAVDEHTRIVDGHDE